MTSSGACPACSMKAFPIVFMEGHTMTDYMLSAECQGSLHEALISSVAPLLEVENSIHEGSKNKAVKCSQDTTHITCF